MSFVRSLEAVTNVALAVTLLWPVRGDLKAVLSAIPRRYALFSLASVGILIGAQATGEGERYYPLTDFDMYTTSLLRDQHRFVEYTAELSSGREQRLLIGRLFPAGGTYLRRRIDESVAAVESSRSGTVDPAAVHKLEVMLAAIVRQHDTRYPGDTIRRIRLWRSALSLRDPTGPSAISRRLIYEYEAP